MEKLKKMESKRLLFIFLLIKEKLKLERCICDSIRVLKCDGMVTKEESEVLKNFFDQKFSENNLPYYTISTLDTCSPRYLAYRFCSNEARLEFLDKLIAENS